MDIFYRLLFPRGSKNRRARVLFLIVAAFAVPALASSFGFAAAGDPQIVEPLTKTADVDGNGRIDQIRVTFSAPMDQSAPEISQGDGDPGIRVDGYAIDTSRGELGGFDWVNGVTLNIYLVEGEQPDTGNTPTLIYVAGGQLEGAAVGELVEGAYGTADGAGPVLIAAQARTVGSIALFDNQGDELFLTFSEPTILAGLTKLDRWSNLERTIRFVNEKPSPTFGAGGGCPTDGDGIQTWNFPQPKAGNPAGTDPIIAPKAVPEILTGEDGEQVEDIAARVFHVRLGPTGDHTPSTKLIPGIPDGCFVGVDPGMEIQEDSEGLIVNRASLTDAAGNLAKPMTEPTIRIFPTGVEAQSAKTKDTNADGQIDAIEVTFSHRIDPGTIGQPYGISLGGTTVAPTSTEAVDDQLDNKILVRFAPRADWTTASAPSISYSEPASCETGGAGLRVSFDGGWSMCIPSFDLQATDGAGPVLLEAKTADGNLDGSIDSIALTFNEAIANTADRSVGWTVDGQEVDLDVDPEDARKATLTLASPVEGTGAGAEVNYVHPENSQHGTMDAQGNQIVAVSGLQPADGAAPRIIEAEQLDSSGDGNIDRAVLTYSEPVLDPASASGFTIGGNAATLVAPAGEDGSNDATLTLAVSGLSGTDTKDIAFTPGAAVRDQAGNEASIQAMDAADVGDLAAPRATVTVEPNAPIPAGDSTVVVTFSEPMDPSVVPTVTFETETDPKEVTEVGWNEAETAWEGTVQIQEADCTVSTGCPVTVSSSGGQDLASPANEAVGATLQTLIDTVAPAPPEISSFAASMPQGESAPENVLNMFARDLTVTAQIPPGEAEGGAATLLLVTGEGEEQEEEAIAGVPITSSSASSVSIGTSYGTASALQFAIDPGAHALTVTLCDAAGNCDSTATALDIVADYEPAVPITLTAPEGGNTVPGGSTLDIVWDADEAEGLDRIEVRYSTDDGQTFPNMLTSTTTELDGTHTWNVPEVDERKVVVRALTVDTDGNKAVDDSARFVIRTNPVFNDVPEDYSARPHIEAIYDADITHGCGSGNYCPTKEVTRGMMAVFLIRSLGEEGNLEAYKGTFADVPKSRSEARYVERLAELNITHGCGGGNYCPDKLVSRAMMAVFVTRAKDWDTSLDTYQGTFSDVPSSRSEALYIEKLADEQVVHGCGQGVYCPDRIVTRAQMAVFIQRAWNLPTFA